MNEYELLKNLLGRAKMLRFKDEAELDDIRRKGKMALENLFPIKTYFIDIGNIKFEEFHYVSMPSSVYLQDWKDGQTKLINLLDTAIKDYEIRVSKQQAITPKVIAPITETKIVIQEKIVPIIDESAILDVKRQFSEYRKSVKNWILFFLVLILSSLGLWRFYSYSNWKWFNVHPKKIGIVLMTNLTILLFLLNIPIKKNWAIWIPTAIAVLATLFTII